MLYLPGLRHMGYHFGLLAKKNPLKFRNRDLATPVLLFGNCASSRPNTRFTKASLGNPRVIAVCHFLRRRWGLFGRRSAAPGSAGTAGRGFHMTPLRGCRSSEGILSLWFAINHA